MAFARTCSRASSLLVSVLFVTTLAIRPAPSQIVTQEVVIPGGGSAFLCWDLEASNEAPVLWTSLVGTQLPAFTTAVFYSPDSTTARGAQKIFAVWSPSTNTMRRGDAFLIQLPPGSSNHTFRMSGWTPTQDVTTLSGISSSHVIGYPYPQAVAWTSTTLASQSPPGTAIHRLDVTNQIFTSYMLTRSGWLNASDLVFRPGESFIWESPSTTTTWTVTRPY